MPLQIGKLLGSYEIASLLGKGGMGEVYRAHDVKLKRDVAIKILPEEFSRDPDRVGRFQREAEALAALNHQNIAGIYDLQQSESTRFLIMEFVEGDTLGEIIRQRGALPLAEALDIGKQICEALEAAHDKGILHRDLKPANVKVMADGKVKVLDFGLAKALDGGPAGTAVSNSPTLSMAATNAGVILGTAAYMSPEQAKGRAVDRRTDVFAFGCVFYEMLTGTPAFDGEDVTDILSRVLQRDPDWTRVPASVPAPIQKLLRICLEKDARKRRQTATDVRIDLEQSAAATVADIPVPTERRSRGTWIASLSILAVLGVALAIPAVRHLRETSPPEMRLEITTPSTAAALEFALSPDGRYIAFIASGDGAQRLWLRALDKDRTSAKPLEGTDGANFPFWAPDSRSIGFFAANRLYLVAIDGGNPQAITNTALNRGGTWGPDGTILFSTSTTSPISRVSATSGEVSAVTQVEKPSQLGHRFPHFLPDGRHFLFYASGSPDARGIYLGTLDGRKPKRLAAADSAGAFLRPDWIVFVRQGRLVAQRLDLSSGELKSDTVILADPVAYDASSYVGAFSISANGQIAYRAGGAERRQLTWFDRTGTVLGMAGEPDATVLAPELSPDENRVAVDRTVQGNRDIWVMDLRRGGLRRLTSDASNDGFPLWSGDGTRVVFESARKGTYDLWIMSASKPGTEELLYEGKEGNEWPVHWSKDGRFLLYYQDSVTGSDLWALPMTGDDRKPVVVANTKFEERQGQFSPDGRWVAFETDETGRFEIVVQPFPNASSKSPVSTNGGIQPRWSADGKELYFLSPDRKLMAAPVIESGATLNFGKPAVLFSAPMVLPSAAAFRPQYAVSRDGRFLINRLLEESTATPITLILNWKPAQR